MSVRYRHRNGQVATFAATIPRLEQDEDWLRLPDDEAPPPPDLDDEPAPTGAGVDAPPPPVLERPAKSANKPAWVAYARSLGIDVTGLNRDELIAAVDELDA